MLCFTAACLHTHTHNFNFLQASVRHSIQVISLLIDRLMLLCSDEPKFPPSPHPHPSMSTSPLSSFPPTCQFLFYSLFYLSILHSLLYLLWTWFFFSHHLPFLYTISPPFILYSLSLPLSLSSSLISPPYLPLLLLPSVTPSGS